MTDEIEHTPTDLTPALRIGPRLLVTVQADGVQLQQPTEAPPLLLSRAGLELLSVIDRDHPADLAATVAELTTRFGTGGDDLALFERRLRRSSRIVTTPAPDTLDRVVPHADGPRVAASVPDGPIELLTPLSFALRDGRYLLVDADGIAVADLDGSEVMALEHLRSADSLDDAWRQYADADAPEPLDEASFRALATTLAGAALLIAQGSTTGPLEFDPGILQGRSEEHGVRVFAEAARRHDEAEAERVARTGRRRPKVIPVAFDLGPPAGLGSIVAYAKVHNDGVLDDFYDFRLDWVWSEDRFEQFTSEPAIYLFSNYMWSHERNIEISRRVKEASPASICIHGGPDTPKYPGDCRNYFMNFPSVDVTVRGEGELTAAEVLERLTEVIGDDQPDLTVLADVAGISYRAGTRPTHTPDRERIADLDALPSPYLSGLFDTYLDVPDVFVTLETNRGCPYGCTFCDWGSATNSRIRKHRDERVYAEIEWAARARASAVTIADANYGIFPRDVDFARRAADLKKATGYPGAYGGNYAKNTVKHLSEIIAILAEAEIMTIGTLSLQSMDEGTLGAIHRSNIKTEKYDAIAIEMAEAGLPLMIELMMGLPGSTLSSFRNDLQECIDRELPVRVNHTALLVNSPMNDPDYLREHQIETAAPIGPGATATLTSTATYTKSDYVHMESLRLLYLLFENFGVLRLVSRFVRQETGMREMDFYDKLGADTVDGDRWPLLHLMTALGPSMMAPPVSWKLMLEELRFYLIEEIGLADDAALDTVLLAQQMLLPSHGRSFPDERMLAHDVAGWMQSVLAAKQREEGRHTWTEEVPRLREHEPASLVVDDPNDITYGSLGVHRELNVIGVNWELESSLQRARIDA